MTFAPGKSGNPGGRPKEKPWRDAIRKALARAEDVGDEKRKLANLAWKLLENAANGDLSALKELGDRLDGKVPQTIAGDDDLDPVTVRTIVTGVPRSGD